MRAGSRWMRARRLRTQVASWSPVVAERFPRPPLDRVEARGVGRQMEDRQPVGSRGH